MKAEIEKAKREKEAKKVAEAPVEAVVPEEEQATPIV